MPPLEDRELIRIDNVSLKFKQATVLQRINLTLRENAIITLIGPNGAGKTTLVRIILGLLAPTTGSITRAPGLRLGYMPQKLHLDPTFPLTVLRFLSLGRKAKLDEVRNTLDRVGALHLQQHSFHDLSGGETQRILLARALLADPQLLVLDEPAQGVDVNGQSELYELISAIRHERACSILMISHDLHLVMSATDHVVCLNQHICCAGHPRSISQDPSFIALFGKQHASAYALYHHHHDHRHDRLDSPLSLHKED